MNTTPDSLMENEVRSGHASSGIPARSGSVQCSSTVLDGLSGQAESLTGNGVLLAWNAEEDLADRVLPASDQNSKGEVVAWPLLLF